MRFASSLRASALGGSTTVPHPTVVHEHRRVIWVVGPFAGIIEDVLLNTAKIALVSDDVFVIIALSHGRAGCGTRVIDALGARRFERTYDVAWGSGRWPDGAA